jgi:phosphoribosyl-dephospho-CoA transferase
MAAQVADDVLQTQVAAWLAADRPLVVARQPVTGKDFVSVGAGPACVVGASAPYNHGVLLAGAAREQKNNRGYEKLLSGHPHGPLLQFKPFSIGNENPDTISVGLALPPAQGKRRIALIVAAHDIARYTLPLRLADAIDHAPAGWQPVLAELDAEATNIDIELRVFGSLAWQALSGMQYLTPRSDIDLLWHPLSYAQLQQGIALLARWEKSSGLRADGEVLFGGSSAVSWREWATLKSGNDQRVLVKRERSAELVAARELLEMLA